MFIPVVADIVATEKHVSSFVALISVAFYASSSLFSVLAGRWADMTGSRAKLIGVGLAFLSMGLLGFFAAEAFAAGSLIVILVIVSSIVAGFGSAFYHPLAATVLQGFFLTKSKGKALGVNGAAGGLGATVYPLLFFFGALFLSRGGAFILLALIGFAVAFIIALGLRVRRTDQGSDSQQRKTNASEALTKGIAILTIVTAVRSVSTTGVVSYLSYYITNQKGAGLGTTLGLTLSAMYASAIFGQLLFGAMMDRFDKRLVLGIGSAGSALSTIGYISTGGVVEVGFIALFGLCTFSIFPTLLGLASEYVPETSSSLGNALVWGLGIGGGSVIGPAAVGLMIGGNPAGLNIAFELMAATGMIGALMTPLMPRPGKAEKPVLMN
jgi:MFS family permease